MYGYGYRVEYGTIYYIITNLGQLILFVGIFTSTFGH